MPPTLTSRRSTSSSSSSSLSAAAEFKDKEATSAFAVGPFKTWQATQRCRNEQTYYYITTLLTSLILEIGKTLICCFLNASIRPDPP